MRKRSRMPKLLSLVLLSLTSSCVTVRDGLVCAVAGKLEAGAICSHLLTPTTSQLTFEEFVAFLEAQASPPRGPAVCMPSEDWNAMKTELETACRELGSRCSLATQQALQKFQMPWPSPRVSPESDPASPLHALDVHPL